jgi:MFS family permease
MRPKANPVDFVQANLRWNFSVNVLDISFYMLALNMVSQTTILPLLVSQLTSSKIAVGMIPAIFSLGFFLPQLFFAGHAEGLRYKKPFLILMSGLTERLPYPLIGIVVWFFAGSNPGLTLTAFFVLLLIGTGTGGMLTPAWYDLIAKVIPVNKRGIYAGVGNGLGALMGIAGAALAGQFLANWPFPHSYALCFLTSAIFFFISWVGLALNREPESPVVKQHASLTSYLKQLPAVLRRDHNYQVFLVARAISYMGWMASGFFIVFGAQRFQLSGGAVGGMTAALVASTALTNLLWGFISDRKGHKIILAFSALLNALAALAALLVQSAFAFGLVFVLLGAAFGADQVSGLNIILEFCDAEERPTFIGLTNTLMAPLKTVAPLLGGWLATWLEYPPMFAIAIFLALAGTAMLGWWVKEPRQVM